MRAFCSNYMCIEVFFFQKNDSFNWCYYHSSLYLKQKQCVHTFSGSSHRWKCAHLLMNNILINCVRWIILPFAIKSVERNCDQCCEFIRNVRRNYLLMSFKLFTEILIECCVINSQLNWLLCNFLEMILHSSLVWLFDHSDTFTVNWCN